MFRFAFGSTDQVDAIVAQRSRHSIDREPYPGIYSQIRQDLRPPVSITEYWDAPLHGASSGLRADWGLAVLRIAQEGDPLSGSNRLRMLTLPGYGLRPRPGFLFWLSGSQRQFPCQPPRHSRKGGIQARGKR